MRLPRRSCASGLPMRLRRHFDLHSSSQVVIDGKKTIWPQEDALTYAAVWPSEPGALAASKCGPVSA